MVELRRRIALIAALCGAVVSAPVAAATAPTIGFYVPWDAASLASLRDHGDQLRVVVPAWISVTGPDHHLTVVPDVAGHAALAALRKPPALWLMVQNALLGSWDGPGAAAMLHDPAATAGVLDAIEAQAVKERASGLVFDLEDLPPSAQADLPTFLSAARQRCRRHGWTLAVTAPVGNPDWDLHAIAEVVDRVILMAYDQHWQTGSPGPIAADPWFRSAVQHALTQLPSTQAIVALASYAYDWPASGTAAILSIDQARQLAAAHGIQPTVDADSGAAHFEYSVERGAHHVWMADAGSVGQQAAIATGMGVRSLALWRLGTEDPAMWTGAERIATPQTAQPADTSR